MNLGRNILRESYNDPCANGTIFGFITYHQLMYVSMRDSTVFWKKINIALKIWKNI
jgi:hypothetical protein